MPSLGPTGTVLGATLHKTKREERVFQLFLKQGVTQTPQVQCPTGAVPALRDSPGSVSGPDSYSRLCASSTHCTVCPHLPSSHLCPAGFIAQLQREEAREPPTAPCAPRAGSSMSRTSSFCLRPTRPARLRSACSRSSASASPMSPSPAGARRLRREAAGGCGYQCVGVYALLPGVYPMCTHMVVFLFLCF